MTRNHSRRFFCIFVFSILAGLLGSGCCTHYTNLDQYKAALRNYYTNSYETDIQARIQVAEKYLQTRCAGGDTNLALVLDIDETSLSNWEDIAGSSKWGMDFGYNNDQCIAWEKQEQATAIGPVLALFKAAQQAGVKVFFITGRHENLRSVTAENLQRVGYDHWDGLYLKPDHSTNTVTEFKSSVHKQLAVDDHYTIILNVGDQWSDLKGGYAEKCIKLPNPFYYIP
jgi:acid phosphatase